MKLFVIWQGDDYDGGIFIVSAEDFSKAIEMLKKQQLIKTGPLSDEVKVKYEFSEIPRGAKIWDYGFFFPPESDNE